MNNEVVKNIKINTLKTIVNNLEKKTSWCNYFDSHKSIQHRYTNFREKIKAVYKKISDTSRLVTTAVANTTIHEVENNIPDTSRLVATNVLNTKVEEVRT